MGRKVSILSIMTIIAVLSVAVVAVAFAAQKEGGQGREKVTLCHKGYMIMVGAPAVDAYLNHDDIRGLCPTEDVDGTRGEIVGDAGDDLTDGSLRGVDLYGNSAANVLRGGPKADFLQGGRGPDRMFGYVGRDYIDGVDGIGGNDVVDGGWGVDHCVGDEGDTFVNCDGNVVEVPVPPGTSGLETSRPLT